MYALHLVDVTQKMVSLNFYAKIIHVFCKFFQCMVHAARVNHVETAVIEQLVQNVVV